jgi:phosphate/sulfate permease
VELYLIIVILLLILATSDLVVGVSNDAVNFLNSAIGSKVASRRVILIVASLGIFMGATFSSGMMEIARKGIFNPEFFFFSEIMIIFLAVMLTDILLLDLFNTFGFPTSTTVSIVFELLGAATAVSLIKITQNGQSLNDLGNYLNGSSALLIISGIFLSIGIAFLVGTIVQFVSRLIFSFHYKKRLPFVGGIWSGLALSGLTYFLLFKGIKGASFVSESFIYWVKDNTFFLLSMSALFWFILMQILVSYFRVNILRFVVLFGTFSLAMAFAGNDLVNFIGVPIAGLESYLLWSQSDIPAGEFTMDLLKEPLKTNTLLLLAGGTIMIVTLWFSRKAQSVTETEVNLGRQGSKHERFTPNFLSRAIVRQSIFLAEKVKQLAPRRMIIGMEKNFQEVVMDKPEDAPAFDLVRASVNLTMAGMLIAFATSLKLPLSTTYVSFMVAMGTSLADRAWGRNSAVYRIAGVLNVIGGWFMTALIAFFVSAVFATLMIYLGIYAIAVLVIAAIIIIFNTFRIHRKGQKRKDDREEMERLSTKFTKEILLEYIRQNILKTLEQSQEITTQSIEGLVNESRKILDSVEQRFSEIKEYQEDRRYQMYDGIRCSKIKSKVILKNYILSYDLEQDMIQSLRLVVKSSVNHVKNSHEPFSPQQAKKLLRAMSGTNAFLTLIIKSQHKQLKLNKSRIKREKTIIEKFLFRLLKLHISDIQKGHYDSRNGQLFVSLILEMEDIIEIASKLARLAIDLTPKPPEKTLYTPLSSAIIKVD